jgi:PAS domain-containing protein
LRPGSKIVESDTRAVIPHRYDADFARSRDLLDFLDFVECAAIVSRMEQDFTSDRPVVEPLPTAWQCDLLDDSLWWSEGVYDLFGLPRGTPLDRQAIVEMYLPESRAELDRLRTAAVAGCGSFTFEACIRRPDGTLRWIRITADVVTEQGRARYLYGSKLDVTKEMSARDCAA